MTGRFHARSWKQESVLLWMILLSGACSSLRETAFADEFVSVRVPGSWTIEVMREADVAPTGDVRRFPRYRVKPGDLVVIEFVLVHGADSKSPVDEFKRLFDGLEETQDDLELTKLGDEPFHVIVRGERLPGVRRRVLIRTEGIETHWSFSMLAAHGTRPQVLVGIACPDSHWEMAWASSERLLNTIVVRDR